MEEAKRLVKTLPSEASSIQSLQFETKCFPAAIGCEHQGVMQNPLLLIILHLRKMKTSLMMTVLCLRKIETDENKSSPADLCLFEDDFVSLGLKCPLQLPSVVSVLQRNSTCYTSVHQCSATSFCSVQWNSFNST